MEQTTARLRKTFRYPIDNDSDDSLPEALDEEEQENLIRTLRHENDIRNKQYATALLAISLLSTAPYLPTLFQPTTSLLSLLSITSLLSTAYLLHIFPPAITGLLTLDDLNRTPSSASSRNQQRSILVQAVEVDRGPIGTYLPLLNLGLCTLLVLAGRLFKGKEEVWVGFGLLPGFVYAVVLVAKVVMGSVDPEAELGSLRYGFKGA